MPSRRRPTGPPAAPPGLFVDSSAWIALRSQRDQHHDEADQLFRDAIARRVPLLTSNLIIAETHRLTLFRAGVQAARRFLELVDESPSVRVHFPTAADHAAARDWLARLGPRPVTYTDAVSFAIMEGTGCGHALTFDQDVAAAGFAIWR